LAPLVPIHLPRDWNWWLSAHVPDGRDAHGLWNPARAVGLGPVRSCRLRRIRLVGVSCLEISPQTWQILVFFENKGTSYETLYSYWTGLTPDCRAQGSRVSKFRVRGPHPNVPNPKQSPLVECPQEEGIEAKNQTLFCEEHLTNHLPRSAV